LNGSQSLFIVEIPKPKKTFSSIGLIQDLLKEIGDEKITNLVYPWPRPNFESSG
jgi:hypothetical protein